MREQDIRFKDKVTIVTGGASGIGRAIAQGFAKAGGIVMVLDNLEEESKRNVRDIESQGGKAVAMKVDGTEGQQVESTIKKIAEEWGRIDILINNIGVEEWTPFLESSEADWRYVLDGNLMVTLHFCRAVLPYMVKQQYGRIVNIASIAGRLPRPGNVVFSATKAGIIAISRSLAVGMAPYGIRINCVCPGTIETAALKQARRDAPKHIENMLKQVTLRRAGQPEEVAAMVLFLASDEASYTVGQSVNVDGGNCML